jgi:hypothetical protein
MYSVGYSIEELWTTFVSFRRDFFAVPLPFTVNQFHKNVYKHYFLQMKTTYCCRPHQDSWFWWESRLPVSDFSMLDSRTNDLPAEYDNDLTNWSLLMINCPCVLELGHWRHFVGQRSRQAGLMLSPMTQCTYVEYILSHPWKRLCIIMLKNKKVQSRLKLLISVPLCIRQKTFKNYI